MKRVVVLLTLLALICAPAALSEAAASPFAGRLCATLDWSAEDIRTVEGMRALCAVVLLLDMNLEGLEGFSMFGPDGDELPAVYFADAADELRDLSVTCFAFYADSTWMAVLVPEGGLITAQAVEAVPDPQTLLDAFLRAGSIADYEQVPPAQLLEAIERVAELTREQEK